LFGSNIGVVYDTDIPNNMVVEISLITVLKTRAMTLLMTSLQET
jgi:hypothetical protein